MSTFLERYRAGEHVAVWDDLMALGAGVRHELYYTDAVAVAAETMRRARQNVELLIQRLDAMDYRFLTMNESDDFHLEGLARSRQTTAQPGGHGIGKKRKPALNDPDVLSPPKKHVTKDLNQLEKLAGGPLPLSLRAWYEEVGGVSLLGWHSILSPGPDEPAGREGIAPDPLMICPLDELMQMFEMQAEEGEGEMRLELAPDAIFKAGEGGGGPYDMVVPNACADGIFGDCNERTFVNYLRNAFHWGGFPGWEDSKTPPLREIAALREGLLPL